MSSRASLLWLLLCSAVSACAAQEPAGPPIARGAFCDRVARAVCDAAADCCTQVDDEDCVELETGACAETLGLLLDDPRLVYVPERAGAYVVALETDASSCFASPRADLRVAFEGTVARGGGCSPASSNLREVFVAASACGEDACRFYLDGAGQVDAICERREVAGEDVCSHPFDCAPTMYCDLVDGWAPGDWGHCRARLGDGWSCTSGGQCESGFCGQGRCAEREGLAQCLFYGYPQIVVADAPLLYLRLDERTGRAATDHSGHANHGTYTDPVEHVEGASGEEGDRALSLAGDRGNARVDGLDRTLPEELSVELFVSIPDEGGGPILAVTGVEPAGADPGAVLRLTADGRTLRASLGGTTEGTTALELASSDGALVAGFHHVALIVHEGRVTLLLDGASVANGSTSESLAPSVALHLGLDPSAADDAPSLRGVIDELALYDRALDLETIAAHAAAARMGATRHDSFVYGWAR